MRATHQKEKMCASIRVGMCVRVCVCLHVCAFVCVCVCACVYVWDYYEYVRVCAYVLICPPPPPTLKCPFSTNGLVLIASIPLCCACSWLLRASVYTLALLSDCDSFYPWYLPFELIQMGHGWKLCSPFPVCRCCCHAAPVILLCASGSAAVSSQLLRTTWVRAATCRSTNSSGK